MEQSPAHAGEVVPTLHPPTTASKQSQLTFNATEAGSAISINGVVIDVPWVRVEDQIAIADFALLDHFGAALFDTEDPYTQPLQWFSAGLQGPLPLTAWLDSGYRFLDITDLASQHNWALTTQGHILQIAQRPTQLQAMRHETYPWGERLVLYVTDATLTQISEGVGEFNLVLHATADQQLVNTLPAEFSETGITAVTVNPQVDKTILTVAIDRNTRPILSTLAEPNRIVIDIRHDFLQARNLLWAPGIRWRQQYIAIGDQSFPVYWLQVDPRQSALNLRPIWSDPTTVTGITPLQTMAQRWQAAAAINAGFFNRNNQYPLGAIRFMNDWVSGPILSRGVIGWDENGNANLSRLFLKQTLTTANGESFPIQAINSGYVQAGIGLYTPAWGTTYRPILDNEIVATVINNEVVAQQRTSVDQGQAIPIPDNGYLLALRSYETASRALPPRTSITLESELLPADLEPFPNIIGGGPLLLQNQNLVLNAEAEQFSRSFATQAAPRSAIGLTPGNELLLVAVHNSPSGPGPTLNELAQIMAKLGSKDALNLDGGGSASLYLGGRLLNRNPRTAARVNNAIGLFFDD